MPAIRCTSAAAAVGRLCDGTAREHKQEAASAGSVKILIIEDHPIVISGLRALLADEVDIEIADARTGDAGIRAHRAMRPDISVVDINLPDASGFDVTRHILSEEPSARILIFTMTDAPILAARSMEAGARGFFSKNDDPNQLKAAIRQIAAGGHWLPDEVAQRLALVRVGCEQLHDISPRELQVLRMLARGRSLAEIADELDVSYKTISNDTIALRTKLNARTPMELVRIAVEQKIV